MTTVLTLFGLIGTGLHAEANPTTKPNVVYILADDMGFGDVKCFNENAKIPTPHLDRLAAEGMRFTDAHSNSSVCTPTRYGILTGRYSWRSRLKGGVLWGHMPHLINTERMTVSSFLKGQGYNTACVGKWHLGMDWKFEGAKPARTGGNVDPKGKIENGPNVYGFDYYYGVCGSSNMCPHAYIENDRMLGDEFVFVKTGKEAKAMGCSSQPGWIAKGHRQDLILKNLAEKSVKWLSKQTAERPFFLYLPLTSPHSPVVPSKDFQGKSGINIYGDFVMETDWVVGEVMRTLKEKGLDKNTLFIFTADNGCAPSAKIDDLEALGHYPSHIYRGIKGTLYEGGHRVPFIARWPKEIQPGGTSDQLLCTTDLLATVAELLGKKLPENAGEDSVSFVKYMKGAEANDAARGMVVHHSDTGRFSARTGDWKVVFDPGSGSKRTSSMTRNNPVKNPADIQLFNLKEDPTEQVNILKAHPEKAKAIKEELIELIMNGRSTPGENQPLERMDKWERFDELKAL